MSEKAEENKGIAPDEEPIESREEVKRDFKGLLESTKVFLHDLLDIRPNTDQEATKEAIIADIPFKGHTSWILICSIFIASIGLNANSTAVVIGAMLISPLMGPILGVGLSLAINDIDTLRRSLKNFAVMVVLSVLTAYLFFAVFPLRDESSELLARTAPDIRDVLIAFFGGLALVIARAKRGTIASVIFGVAIATALMPPLCTVGFGIAIGNFEYAMGAMYLFTINTIFIALATFLIIKLLRFPMVRYANSQKRRRTARIASIIAILVMIPAGYTFYNVFQESRFKKQANDFISEKIMPYQFSKGGRFLKDFSTIEYNDGKDSSIELVFMGNETIPENIIDTWNAQKEEFSKLTQCDLRIIQGSNSAEVDQFKYVNELYESQKNQLLGKDDKIKLLESELSRLQKLAANQIPFAEISAEARANYENLLTLSYSQTITTDFNTLDTIPVFEVKWKPEVAQEQKQKDAVKLTDWLKLRLKDNKIQLKEVTMATTESTE
ncbi:DUF389 domain-containing protein [Kriegella aquimaris]|uniref:Uncharacterized hydrophobic domain-containing protein n=1 Tax=Kriegella aquimaris TaxID=192904 RepID=A0A1G9PY14_9FLAO|nr:DUF389 domain-containing protein [Kriegella aquimaris]SDM02975.1 uncharacterized hydrophobic domain-containing protein [Kriegella aquimaris]